MKKPDFDAVKQLSIIQFLAAVNVVPLKIRGAEHTYRSPIRTGDTMPSFFVNALKNCWIDFGAGHKVGGNIIDLAMRVFSTDFKTAARFLVEIFGNPHTMWQADAAVVANEQKLRLGAAARVPAGGVDKLTIERSGDLEYGPMREQLTNRKINLSLIMQNGRLMSKIKEVWYYQPGQRRSKPYFALGFVNESGGLELNAPGFKSCHGDKDVTYFKGRQPGCVVFESMTDCLAAITIRKKHYQCSVLILHSTSMERKALPYLVNEAVVHLYLDNDEEGLRCAAFLRKNCPNTAFVAQNEVYRGFKDVNDYLMGKKPAKALPSRGGMASAKSQTARWWLWVVFTENGSNNKVRMQLEADGQWRMRRNPKGECTFYSYNNQQDGYEALLALRHRLQDEVNVSRLCERTVGRKFTHEQVSHFLSLPQDRLRLSIQKRKVSKTVASEKNHVA